MVVVEGHEPAVCIPATPTRVLIPGLIGTNGRHVHLQGRRRRATRNTTTGKRSAGKGGGATVKQTRQRWKSESISPSSTDKYNSYYTRTIEVISGQSECITN